MHGYNFTERVRKVLAHSLARRRPLRRISYRSMTRTACLGLVLSCAAAASSARAQTPAACAMVGLRVVATEILVAEPPAAHCPNGRLVVTDTPRVVPIPGGYYRDVREFDVPVAIENSGAAPIRLPIGMRGDSITAVQHGQQLSELFSQPYHDMRSFGFRTGRRPWTFRKAGTPTLAPGQRSPVQTVRIAVGSLAQGLRFWFSAERIHDGPLFPEEYVGPPPRYDEPLPASVRRFVNSAGLDTVKDVRTVFRLADRDLTLFEVRFGPALDCASGCFWSSALGLQYGKAVGWLTMEDYGRRDAMDRSSIHRDSFPAAAVDAYLLSPAFLDTLTRAYAHAWQQNVRDVRDYIVRDPRLPRAILVQHVEALYHVPGIFDWKIGKLLAGLPRVQDDVELLTLLAYLPYESGKSEALYRLQTLAPRLVHDTATPARALFLVAPTIRPDVDSALFRRLLEHPHVRGNVAILAELAHHNAEVRRRLLAVVRASPRVRAELDEYLAHYCTHGAQLVGMRLLADPDAGVNEDVLLVLANAEVQDERDVRATATRRLPEAALRRADFTYHPLR